jgi:hypothetical protein
MNMVSHLLYCPVVGSTGSAAHEYSYGWGFPIPGTKMGEEGSPPSAEVKTRVREVKRNVEKPLEAAAEEDSITKKRRKFSFFPLPHDHLDDIFLSTAGID